MRQLSQGMQVWPAGGLLCRLHPAQAHEPCNCSVSERASESATDVNDLLDRGLKCLKQRCWRDNPLCVADSRQNKTWQQSALLEGRRGLPFTGELMPGGLIRNQRLIRGGLDSPVSEVGESSKACTETKKTAILNGLTIRSPSIKP